MCGCGVCMCVGVHVCVGGVYHQQLSVPLHQWTQVCGVGVMCACGCGCVLVDVYMCGGVVCVGGT